jgi:putative transposase
VDCSPAQVWSTLLGEGRYLASERTMYRLLAARHGGVRERRDQLTHPCGVPILDRAVGAGVLAS